MSREGGAYQLLEEVDTTYTIRLVWLHDASITHSCMRLQRSVWPDTQALTLGV